MGNCWSFQSNPALYLDVVLKAHNAYREHHLSPPLTLDKDRCKEASMHANLCAYHDQVITFRGGTKGASNIYVDHTDNKELGKLSPCTPVNDWYGKMRYHRFAKTWKENEKSIPFSNMIWKGGKTLGVGFARTTNKNKKKRVNYIVCVYDEVKEDHIGENVLRPYNDLPSLGLELLDNASGSFVGNSKKDYIVVYKKTLNDSWSIAKNTLGVVSKEHPEHVEWKKYFVENNVEPAVDAYFIAVARSLAERKLGGGTDKAPPPPPSGPPDTSLTPTPNTAVDNSANSPPPTSTADPNAAKVVTKREVHRQHGNVKRRDTQFGTGDPDDYQAHDRGDYGHIIRRNKRDVQFHDELFPNQNIYERNIIHKNGDEPLTGRRGRVVRRGTNNNNTPTFQHRQFYHNNNK